METDDFQENIDGNGQDLVPVDDPLPTVKLGSDELDVQITTAKRFPRSLKKFQQEALGMAIVDQDTAASCFYVLERKDWRTKEVHRIEGPSVRLSEIVANTWENLYCAQRVIGESEDRRFIIAEGVAWDLQKNVRRVVRVVRRITNRMGKRYSDDMIATTGNAACSIAARNAIFQTVPKAYWEIIYKAAKELAIGNATSLQDRRKRMLEHFAKMGVSKAMILQKCDKEGIEDIGLDDLESLVGLATAIRDGDTTVLEAFQSKEETTEEPETLAEKIANKAETVKRGRGRPPKAKPEENKDYGKLAE